MNGTADRDHRGRRTAAVRISRRECGSVRLSTEEIAHPARQRALRVSGVQPGATDIHGGDLVIPVGDLAQLSNHENGLQTAGEQSQRAYSVRHFFKKRIVS